MAECTYEIGGKRYIQRPLVLGQIRQLMTEMGGISINPGAGGKDIIMGLMRSNQLERVLAVVLLPEGEDVRSKNIDAIASDIETGITPEQIITVVEDFFECNPTASFLERLIGVISKVRQSMPGIPTPTGLNPLFASSPTETLPDETPSSGESPQPSAALTSNTEAES